MQFLSLKSIENPEPTRRHHNAPQHCDRIEEEQYSNRHTWRGHREGEQWELALQS